MQTMTIIPGKTIANNILESIKNEILKEGLKPVLKIYFIGDDIGSAKYIELKVKRGSEVGVEVIVDKFDNDVEISTLSDIIIKDAIDSNIDGMIIQLPFKNPEIKELYKLIPVSKDVDGLNPMSLGLLWQNDEYVLIPATAKAIVKSLEYVAFQSKISLKEMLKGKNCLIVNRSLIIGKPIASVLLQNDATVTIAHSKSENFQELISRSEIIISATGKTGFLNSFTFPQNAIVIDAGFNINDGKVLGDLLVDEEFGKGVSYLSSVPGGVGPIGVACLLENTLIATKKNLTTISTDLA